MDAIVDIDDLESWPPEVTRLVESVIEAVTDPDWRDFPYDHLGWTHFEAEEWQLRELLNHCRLVGYHATRLLPHEIDQIREVTGLAVLTEKLRVRKVSQARGHHPDAFAGDDPNGDALLRSGPHDWHGTADVRLGYLDFVAPFTMFDHDARGLMNLLNTWGGETLGWIADGKTSSTTLQKLTALSKPAIVKIAAHVEAFLDEYNRIRPHEAIGWQRPLDRYLETPETRRFGSERGW